MNGASWSALAAWVALAASVGLPLWRWIRRPRLMVEIAAVANIKTVYGNPGMQLQVVLSRPPGRDLRIRGMRMNLQRGGDAFTLPVHGLFLKPDDQLAVLWAPFALRAETEWSYLVNFVLQPERHDNRMIMAAQSALRADIVSKLAPLEKNAPEVEGDPKIWQPLVEYSKQHFKWLPGEYRAELVVETMPKRSSNSIAFRFTIFESDTETLQSVFDGYRYGYGVCIPIPAHKQQSINADLAIEA